MKSCFKIDVYPAGRLGNQLFQLAAASTVSLEAKLAGINSRIVWHADDSITDDILKFIDVKIERKSHPWITRLLTNERALKDRALIIRGIYKFWWKIQERNREALPALYSENDFNAMFKKSSCLILAYHQDFEWVKRSLEKYHASYSIEPILLSENLNQRIESENPICVHLRFGDYLNSDVKATLGELSSTYYAQGIAILDQEWAETSKRAGGGQPIWIFSDDIIQAKLKLKIADREIVGSDEFNLSSAEELALLAKSQNKVLSNSTYSWWAGYLSKDDSITIAPSPLIISLENNPAKDPRWRGVNADFL